MTAPSADRLRCGDVIEWVAERHVATSATGELVWIETGAHGTYITGTPPDPLVVSFPDVTFTCPPRSIARIGRP